MCKTAVSVDLKLVNFDFFVSFIVCNFSDELVSFVQRARETITHSRYTLYL